jgi:predicted metalloprotease with PDZ domain
VAPDGSFDVQVATESVCQLQLSRPFGELVLTGPRVEFVEGGVYAPPAPEGLGVAAVSDGAALRVVAVEPGMPAARAGLRVGDLVTSVEGVAPDGFTPELFDDLPQGRTLRITRGDTEVVVRP